MTQTSNDIENKTISINLLDPHKRNYRKHPDSQLHNLTESLKAFGQTRSIVVRAKGDGRYTILAGHGITEAARRLKFKAMRCDIVPDSWTDQQALAYIAADNQAGFEDDLVMLAELLEEIKNDSDIPLEALGHSEESLAALLDSLADAEINRTTELNEPAGGKVQESFSVLVECKDEDEQERAYNLLQAQGFKCKVLTL